MPNCYKCGKQLGQANWTGGPDKFWHRYGCLKPTSTTNKLSEKEKD